MALGEDLLLLALVPRSGRIREADRLKYALRASVLVDLALAHRITMNANRIKVLDAAATGDRRLDNALVSLAANTSPSLSNWIKETPSGFGMVNRYLSILADQGVVRLDRHRGRMAAPMHATLLDQARRDAAVARIDRVAYGRESDEADRALARLTHACSLHRHLYIFSPLARMRISRLRSYTEVADSTASSAAVADAAVAEVVAQAISDGIAQLTAELVKLLRYEYWIEHTGANDHNGTSSSHHGGHGDSGSGHHS